jgi:hypothetical protein
MLRRCFAPGPGPGEPARHARQPPRNPARWPALTAIRAILKWIQSDCPEPPNSYTGAELRTAHAGLAGLNDWHFDRVIGYLGATLRELGAAEPDTAAAGAIAESRRDQALNR